MRMSRGAGRRVDRIKVWTPNDVKSAIQDLYSNTSNLHVDSQSGESNASSPQQSAQQIPPAKQEHTPCGSDGIDDDGHDESRGSSNYRSESTAHEDYVCEQDEDRAGKTVVPSTCVSPRSCFRFDRKSVFQTYDISITSQHCAQEAPLSGWLGELSRSLRHFTSAS
jgi:hypothetical protein